MTQRCRAWPEQEEGPYHLEVDAFRQDVVGDRVGVPLDLAIPGELAPASNTETR